MSKVLLLFLLLFSFSAQAQFHKVRPNNEVIPAGADAVSVRDVSSDSLIESGRYSGAYIVHVRGANADIDTAGGEDLVSAGGTYAGFPTATVEALMLVSDSVSDTGDVEVRCLESATDEEYETYTYTLTGTTAVNTGRDVYRCNHLRYLGTNVGVISAYWETTTSVIFGTIPAGNVESTDAVYTCPYSSTCYLVARTGSVLGATSAVSLTTALWYREFGGAATLKEYAALDLNGGYNYNYPFGVRLAGQSDFALRATAASGDDNSVVVGFDVKVVKD